jgi:type IVB pilus formation R64 PilN family outer membrane protein
MKKFVLTLTAMSVALSGCSDLIGVKRDVDRDIQTNTTKLDKSIASMGPNQSADARLLYTTVASGSWIGVKKVQPKFDAHLPDVFNKDVTLVFPDRANISTVAERIAKVTGLPVKLRPDVFMKASALVPTGANGGSGEKTPTTPLTPSNPSGIVAATTTQDYRLDMTLNYTGPLSGLLDAMVAKAGLNWEYKDGAIVVYRLVTKTFVIKSTPGSSELTESIGKGGGTQTGTTGGSNSSGSSSQFSSDSTVKMGSKFSIWDNLKESVNAMLTPVGKVAVTEATGTLTITDTREVVDQVQTMVEQINKNLSRQVSFRVEVLSVDTSKSASYGIDWNMVFNKVSQLNPSWKLALSSPTSVASSDAGSLGYSILTPAGADNARSALSGSQTMLKALNQVGPTTVVTTASAVTLNRQPVPVAITDQTGYVASVSAQATPTATTTSSTDTLVQINPGTVTTGFILNLLPSVTDDNSVLLQFSVDISTLKALTTFGSGQLAVQSPEVTAMQFMQRVGLRNGETLVLSGFERKAGQYNRSTLGENTDLLMGGSINGQRTREAVVILITPVITEGV